MFPVFLLTSKQNFMQKNMGNTDKAIRILGAVVMAALYFTGMVTGVVGIIMLVVAVVFVLTSLVSFCPIYTLFGVSTCPKPSKNK